MSQNEAARTVFDSKEYGVALMANPKLRQALINEQVKNAVMLGLTRDQVLQGMMDAVDQAKTMADPVAQIAGWREIAKICGFYAPEVKKIELTGGAKRVVDRMQQLSDKELFEIANATDIDFVEASDAGKAD